LPLPFCYFVVVVPAVVEVQLSNPMPRDEDDVDDVEDEDAADEDAAEEDAAEEDAAEEDEDADEAEEDAAEEEEDVEEAEDEDAPIEDAEDAEDAEAAEAAEATEDAENAEDVEDAEAEELLSPISLRELLTIDEMADRDPSFIGLDDNQVLNYAHDLFPSISKAHGIAKLWRHVVDRRVPPSIAPALTPILDLERLTSTAMPPAWVTAAALANALPTVQQRIQELERLSLPYAVTPNVTSSDYFGPTIAELGSREVFSILQDRLRLTAADVRMHSYMRIPMLGVKAPNRAPRRFTLAESQSWRAHTRAYEFRRRQGVVADVILAATTAAAANAAFTIDDWKHRLAASDLAWDDLTVLEMGDIGAHLAQHADANITDVRRRARAGVAPVKPLPLSAVALTTDPYAAFEAFELKNVKASVLIKKLEALNAASEVRAIDFGLFKTRDLAALFADAASNVDAMAKLIADLRDLRIQQERQDARAFLEAAIDLLPADAEESKEEQEEKEKEESIDSSKIHVARTKFALTHASALHTVVHAEANFPPFTDLKEAEAGADIQGYTGSLVAGVLSRDAVAEATEEGEEAMDWSGLQLLAPEPTGNVGTSSTSDSAGSSVSMLSTLLRPMLQAMADATQLPLPMEAIERSIANVEWTSAVAILSELMPEGLRDLSTSQLSALIRDPSVVDQYLSKDTQALTKRALADVRTRFAAALNDALVRAFATWTVVLQETFIDRRLLDYTVPPALAACGHLWGYHGPPMSQTKGRGVSMFLLCVFQQTAPPETSTSFLERGIENAVVAVGAMAELVYPERVAALQQGFEALKPVFLAQREALKKEQAHLKGFLEGNGTVSRYLAGLLQLPQIMARSSETFARRRQRTGCCEQTLDEGYRAYADWSGNRLLKTLQKQMHAWDHSDLHIRRAGTGLLTLANATVATATSKPAALCKPTIASEATRKAAIALDQDVAAKATTTFADVLAKLRPWLPIELVTAQANASRYILSRLEALAAATRQPTATASTWFSALQSRRFEGIVTMAHALATEAEAHAPLAALRQLRTVTLEDADEQRVLDLARALMLSWIDVRNRDSADAATVILNAASTPAQTAVSLQNKISELRERQKANLLNRLNNTDDNMRQLMTSMNRLGIINIRGRGLGEDAGPEVDASGIEGSTDAYGDANADVDANADRPEDAPDVAPWRGENEDGDEDSL